ncbi:MAG: hypothetical protein ACJ8AI_09390 [Rhodopila sp.]
MDETTAMALEGPIMLASSWMVSLRCIQRVHLRRAIAPRLPMGMVAFALLIMLGAGFSVLVFGRTIAAWFAQYQTVPGLIGFAAQCAFGLVPMAQAWRWTG